MATTMTAKSVAATPRLGLTRTLTIAGAAAAAVAVWAIAVGVFGEHLTFRFGNAAPQTLAVGFVIGASLLGGLLGWGVLTLLERRIARARAIWTAAAGVVLIASLTLPLIAATTVSAKLVLAVMHVAVAGVLILGLRRGSAPQR
jgi:hypothetical protein